MEVNDTSTGVEPRYTLEERALLSSAAMTDTPPSIHPTFGSNLRYWRIRAGLRQDELAERAGYTRGSVSDWERGRQNPPSYAVVLRLAAVLSVPVPCLWDHTRWTAPGPNDRRRAPYRRRKKVD
mgnify:CR=1 FL=1